MDRVRKIVDSSPQWVGLEPYLVLIEQNRESNSKVALDGAKSIVETIAKTILADRGVAVPANSNLGPLVKQAVRSLPVIAEMDANDSMSAVRLASGVETVSTTIGELRNRHGAVSHGQDIHDPIHSLESSLAYFAIESAEAVACFLLKAHSADVSGVARLHYEEYEVFNTWLDERAQVSEESGVEVSISRALFDQDPVGYKEKLLEYKSLPPDLDLTDEQEIDMLIEALEYSGSFGSTHAAIADLAKVSTFSSAQVNRLLTVATENTQISWILEDADVHDFYNRILTGSISGVDPDVIEKFRFVFSA